MVGILVPWSKRQGVNADVICFVTPDINFQDRMKLAVVFDQVIRVPYISAYEMPDDGIPELKTIMMDPKIFDNCNNYTKNASLHTCFL